MSFFLFLSILVYFPLAQAKVQVQEPIMAQVKAQGQAMAQAKEPAVRPAMAQVKEQTTEQVQAMEQTRGQAHFDLEAISPYKVVQKGQTFLVAIKVSIYEDWYSYWSFPGDYGLPTVVKVLPAEGDFASSGSLAQSETDLLSSNRVSVIGLPLPHPERKSLSLGDKNSYSFVYEEEFLIPFEISIPQDYQKSSLNLSFLMDWGLCKEICLSLQNTVTLSLPVADSFISHQENQKLFDFWSDRFPVDSQSLNLRAEFWETSPNKQILSFLFDQEIQCLDLFPKSESDFLSSVPRLLSQNSQSCVLEVDRSQPDRSLVSGLLIYSQSGDKKSTLFEAHRKKKPMLA